MRRKKLNIKIYSWIALHIITFFYSFIFILRLHLVLYICNNIFFHYSISIDTNESNF